MNRLSGFLVASVVVLFALVAAGPTLVALTEAALPLVIAVGVVAAVLWLVSFHTQRW